MEDDLRLTFPDWSRRIVHGVRRRTPQPVVVKAPRPRTVTISGGGRVATISEAGTVRSVTVTEERRSESVTLATFEDPDRGDAGSAESLADSIAGYLD